MSQRRSGHPCWMVRLQSMTLRRWPVSTVMMRVGPPPSRDKVRGIQAAEAYDVFNAFKDVIRDVGYGVGIGVNENVVTAAEIPWDRARRFSPLGVAPSSARVGIRHLGRLFAGHVVSARLQPAEIVLRTGERHAPVALQAVEASGVGQFSEPSMASSS